MAVNKVVTSSGTTLIDLTGDTVTSASHIMNGYVGHLANGSQVTGTGSSGPSATQHVIYFEFSDSTSTSINVYYNDSLIGTMITAYTPTTYGNKTVTLAQLDGVTWYEASDIPLNTQLIDFNNVKTGYVLNSSGAIVAGESWECVTDYTQIDSSMTFTFKCVDWYSVGFYDSNKNLVSLVDAHQLGTSANDVITGTLTSSVIPQNASYIILPGNPYSLQGTLSLIRTA